MGNVIALYQVLFGWIHGIRVCRLVHVKDPAISAHIFGAGASAIKTRRLLDEHSHSFGCNLTLALLPKWNYGFVERLQNNAYGNIQMSILMDRQFSDLILKNNYPFKRNKTKCNIQRLVEKHSIVTILKESQIIGRRDDLGNILTHILNEKTSFISQYASSILTMIIFAKRCGYKNIVLHGVDHGGACFYDLEEFSEYKDSREVTTGSRHQTDGYLVPFSLVLEKVILHLASHGVIVRYAKELL